MPTIASQTRDTEWKTFTDGGVRHRIRAHIRHDDSCRNGHNTFAITGTIDRLERARWRDDMGGCIHKEVAQHFPELAHLIPYHLMSADGPLHYAQNTLYHLGWTSPARDWGTPETDEERLRNARSSAVWPELPESFIAPQELRHTSWPNPKEPDLLQPQRNARMAEIRAVLDARLPALMADFRRDIEAFGFTF